MTTQDLSRLEPFVSGLGKAILRELQAAQAQAEPYDQQALELCDVCGWKTVVPGEDCLMCEKQAQAAVEPVAWRWSEVGATGVEHWFNWTTEWEHHDRAVKMGCRIGYAYPTPPDHTAAMRAALDALYLNVEYMGQRNLNALAKTAMVIEGLKQQLGDTK